MTRRFVLFLLSLCLTVTFPPAGAWGEKETRKKGAAAESVHKSGKKKKGGKKGTDAAPKKQGKNAALPAVQNRAGEGEAAHSADPALVTEMRHWSNPSYTRIAVTLEREAPFEHHQLPPSPAAALPPRVYIDVKGAKLASGVRDIPIGDGLLKVARIGQYKPDVVRVVLDLENIKEFKIFTFSDPFRIIVDVKGERKTEIARLEESIKTAPPVPEAKKGELREEKPKPAARVSTGKIRRIVVDPGHGGHDPGAIGAGGTMEKEVVLQIGLRLARKLREELELDVVMTRSSDIFIPLQERTAIANQVNADLFVSIHANASPNRSTAGVETFYLNLAKSEKTAQLAARENGTSLEKVSLLQAVLFDLMANYKLNDSAHLAEEVQKSLHKRVERENAAARNLGVKQGPFYVLVGATMPSILVETAFISNEREEAHLKDPHYQDVTAEGILEGIRKYIKSLK